MDKHIYIYIQIYIDIDMYIIMFIYIYIYTYHVYNNKTDDNMWLNNGSTTKNI